MTDLDRRQFLRRGAAMGGAAALTMSAMQALNLGVAAAQEGGGSGGGGSGPAGGLRPMRPVRADTAFPGAADIEWIALPEGFKYTVFGITGDVMSDGNITPYAHDGMAAYDHGRTPGRIRLVRNHENRDEGGPTIAPDNAYDPAGGGGCTTLEVRINDFGVPRLRWSWVTLNGTIVNCAGGLTPAGSWISSEETVEIRDGVKHGYNFEVPARRTSPVRPRPLVDMGRFSHEAVAVDPRTGIVYETEDNGDSGLYRYLPNDRHALAAGGPLQMLKVTGTEGAQLAGGGDVGSELLVEWVDIAEPDGDTDDADHVKNQGLDHGAALFARLEGCWWSDDHLYFAATNGGAAGEGQIWRLLPLGHDRAALELVFESPSGDVLSAPDNLTVTPHGGLLLCEDHGFNRPDDPFAPIPNVENPDDAVQVQYLKGIHGQTGELFDFAANLLDDKEWAGACFDPSGTYLFANTQGTTSSFDPDRPQDHGRTFAIWGPWDQLGL